MFRRRRLSAIRRSVHETLSVAFNFPADAEGTFAHRSGNGLYFSLVKVFADRVSSVEVQVHYEEVADELVFTLYGPSNTEINIRRFPLAVALADALVIARLMVKEYENGYWVAMNKKTETKKVALTREKVVREKRHRCRMFDFT